MNGIISSFHYLKYFVLNHPKFIPIFCSAEMSVALLIIFVFKVEIVRMGEVGIAVSVLVTFICNTKVMPTFKQSSVSECCPDIIPIVNCKLFLPLNERHFFPEFKLQQERTARRITNILLIFEPLPL
jgi:hypothetical protein